LPRRDKARTRGTTASARAMPASGTPVGAERARGPGVRARRVDACWCC